MVWSPQESASELTFFQGSTLFPRLATVLPLFVGLKSISFCDLTQLKNPVEFCCHLFGSGSLSQGKRALAR
jgi:hypothetical protein